MSYLCNARVSQLVRSLFGSERVSRSCASTYLPTQRLPLVGQWNSSGQTALVHSPVLARPIALVSAFRVTADFHSPSSHSLPLSLSLILLFFLQIFLWTSKRRCNPRELRSNSAQPINQAHLRNLSPDTWSNFPLKIFKVTFTCNDVADKHGFETKA